VEEAVVGIGEVAGAGDCDAALPGLDRPLAVAGGLVEEREIVATGASYDERVFGEWSWGLIGLCRFALGDDEAAADAFRRAERYAPGDASYVVRRRLAEARAGSSA